jgi:hypothetical protein
VSRIVRSTVAMLLISVVTVAGVRAYDLMSPRGTGMGNTVVLSSPTAANLVNVVGIGLGRGQWRLDGGYNRRFELADLDRVYLAGAWRWRQWLLAAGAQQFGNPDLYAEQLLKGSVAFRFDSLCFGASLSGMQVQLGNGYGTLRASTVGVGVSYRRGRLLGALAADDLTSPRLVAGSRATLPSYSALMEILGFGSYSITGRMTLQRNQTPQFALGQIISLSGHGSLFWGFSTAPTEYGGGFEIYIPSGSLSYATSVHPVLGFTHTVSFSYGSALTRAKKGNGFE